MPLKCFKKITHEMVLDVFKVTTQTMACKIMLNTRLKRSITNLFNFQIKSVILTLMIIFDSTRQSTNFKTVLL